MSTLLRATSVIAKGDWQDAVDSVILEFSDRHTNNLHLQGLQGTEFLLDLARQTGLRHGDALKLEDGRLVEVIAAPEALMEIKGEPHQLSAIAYHLGNRHVPLQISGAKLRIRHDSAMAEFAKALGARVIEIETAFEPEGGDYVAPQSNQHHGHDHHNHDHSSHDHRAHDHSSHHHSHDHHNHDNHNHDDHNHPHHVHGPDCKHDH